MKYVFWTLIYLATKSVFPRNKTFLWKKSSDPKTNWLQKLSCRTKNENLFLCPNQEMLRFKYLHHNCFFVHKYTANYSYSFANNPHSRISQVSIGSRIFTLWPEEGKHGQTNFIIFIYLSLQILVNLMGLLQKYL